MTFASFDVVVVPFPYSDRLAEKRRPALVVSAPEITSRLGRVWVAMITSVLDKPGLGDCVISDLELAGLPVRSLIRASKLATLDAERVLRVAGSLSGNDRQRAITALQSCSAFQPTA